MTPIPYRGTALALAGRAGRSCRRDGRCGDVDVPAHSERTVAAAGGVVGGALSADAAGADSRGNRARHRVHVMARGRDAAGARHARSSTDSIARCIGR